MIRHSLILLMPLMIGCLSTADSHPTRLPFRVALLPIESPQILDSGARLEGEATEVSLRLDGSKLVNRLQQALNEHCFVDVQILDVDSDHRVDAQAQLLEQAASLEADLLVELDLRYQSVIWRKTNSSYWLNLPLFFVAGPAMYFLHDHSYSADVELTATVYDCPSIVSRENQLGDQASRYLTSQNHFTGTDLSFPQRVDSRFDYLYTLVIPSGFLARDTNSVGDRVADDVVDDLTEQLLVTIQNRRQDLLDARHISPLSLTPEEIQLERKGSDVWVAGQVRVHDSSVSPQLHLVRLKSGGQSVRATIGSPERQPDGSSLYAIAGKIQTDSPWLRIEAEVGARDRMLRSFTFSLETASNTP